MQKLILFLIALCYLPPLYAQKISMQEAVDAALQNNPEISRSEARISAAKARHMSGIALPQPEITVNYEYIPDGKNFSNYDERSIEIRQGFDFPLKYFLRSSILNTETMIAVNELRAARLNIIYKVKMLYLNVLSKTELLKVAGDNLAVADTFYKKADTRYKIGEASNLEKMTAKVQYIDALNSVEVQKSQLNLSMSELACFIGFGIQGQNILVLSDSLGYSQTDASPDSLTAFAAKNNPQLVIDNLKCSSSSVQKDLAWSSLLPDFSFSYARQSLAGNNSFYGASLGITIPLWAAFDQRGRIEEAAANERAANAEFISSRNSVLLRVKSAYAELMNTEKQVLLFRKEILPQASEILRCADKSYEAGEISYLEFLQAKQTTAGARSGYINALLAYNQALAALENAVGTID